jgi:ABC-2 type transport system permease protein
MAWLFAQLVVFSSLLWLMTRKTMAQTPVVTESIIAEPQESKT